MNNGYNQLDMSHSLSAYFLFSNLYTASVTHNSLVPDALVFSASTLVVFDWAENLFTEKTVSLRLIGSVVNGLWFQYFAIGPVQD
jgi:hypothetical protein